mgnify:CR=1 FL=1
MNLQTSLDLVAKGKDNCYDLCYEFSRCFIRKINGEFTSEDVILAYKNSGQQQPNEYRVFGAVFRKLATLNMIEKVRWDTYKNPKGHCKPCAVWKKTDN